MLGIVIFYTAFISSVLPINGIPQTNNRDEQLETIVKLLEGQAEGRATSEETNDDAQNFMEEDLRTMDVINLIKQANTNRKKSQNYNNRQKFRVKPNSLNPFYQNSLYDFNRNDRNNNGKNEGFFDNFLTKETKPPKNRFLTPNRLLSPYNKYKSEEEDRRPKSGLDETSKIFVILDPTALKKSRNAYDLPELLARIIAQTPFGVDKSRQEKKVQRYKGFVVKDNPRSRRFRRESKEMYGGGGGGGGGADLEDDYRPKRPRNDHNGGGGGGGRTAIPYIRHRGDIYERDH